jgi:peptide/nickel transport system substrate-binding protein
MYDEEYDKLSRRKFLAISTAAAVGGIVGGVIVGAVGGYLAGQATAPEKKVTETRTVTQAAQTITETKTTTITAQPVTTTVTHTVTATPKPPVTTETTQATTTAPVGKPGGTVIIACEKDENTFDPIFAMSGAFTDTVLNHVYEQLVVNDYQMKIVPQLAESFKMIDDTTYEFRIRKGVKFHDGTDLNAEIVKWNFDRILTTDAPRKGSLLMVDRVDIVDAYTVRFKLKYPTSEFLPALTWGTGIVSKAALEKYGKDYGTTAAVGTGPYKFVEWSKGDHATLERFDGYWGEKPYVDRIVLRVIPEASVRAMALEKGEVHLAQLEASDARRLEKIEGITILLGDPARMITISINMNPKLQGTPALLDKRVRQAINYAIDRKALIESVEEGLAVPGIGPVQPAVKQFWNTSLQVYPYTADIEKAKQLLAEAGYPNGFKTKLLNMFPWGLPVATVIQAQLARVGIEVEIDNVEFGRGAVIMLVERTFDMSLHDWQGIGGQTPYGAVGNFYYSTKVGPWEWNMQSVNDPILDWLIDDLIRQMETGGQKALSDSIQRRIIEEAYGVILYYPYKIHGSRRTVKGYEVHPDMWYGFIISMPVIGKNVWLET